MEGPCSMSSPRRGEVATFISDMGNAFSAADNNGKWDILAEQQIVAQYGNGSNAYNMYRRTGYPTTLQFSIEPAPGGFVRSFLYPSDEANTNPNVTQKPNVNGQIFWDTNPSSPGFPSAN